jgi:hypothetical protein
MNGIATNRCPNITAIAMIKLVNTPKGCFKNKKRTSGINRKSRIPIK